MASENNRPVRVLVLRGVDGAGGGADEIILRTGTCVDPDRVRMRLCFFRHVDDGEFTFEDRSCALGLDYCEIKHRGPFDWRVSRKLRAAIDEFKPDIVHSHDYKANFFNRLASRRCGHKTLATSHGWTGHGVIERRVYYPGDRHALKGFDRVIGVSNDIRDTLVRSGVRGDRVTVLLNGIDPDSYVASAEDRARARKTLGISDSEIILGAVGRIERQKRFDLLLKAFVLIRAEIPNVKLLIAGEGSLKDSIQSLIDQMGLNDSCTMLGHCDDMRATYQAFDLLVQSSDYEGTPTVVVEAMALGVPVVATDAGGTAQLAFHDEHALIVPCGEPSQLAAAAISAIQNREDTERRAAAARKRAETELTFANRVERLTAIYESLVS